MIFEQIILVAGVCAPAAFKRSFMSTWFVNTRLVSLFSCALCLGWWTTIAAVLMSSGFSSKLLLAVPGSVIAYIIDRAIALLESHVNLAELQCSRLLERKD